MRRLIPLSALALAITIAGVSPSPVDAQKPALAGNWTPNQDESDDMEEVMSRQRNTASGVQASRRGQRGGSRVGGLDGGGQGRGAGGAPPPSEEQQRQGRAMMQVFQQPTSGLEILQSDSTVTLVFGSQSQIFFTDGRKLTRVLGDGVETEVKAEWKGDKLKIETKTKGNAKVTQEFKLDDKTGRLVLETKLENSRMNQNFKAKLVFDPAT